jgi:signal transduction histidine kinase
VHRFAEPFDDLSARLDLDPLPGSDTAASIYMLAALLGLALVIGLFALDRMTRVVVEYAERRSDFVAAVSHELRTPLTAIRMYAEMLRDGLVASESKRAEYYETITDESERLSRLIDNVLEFSRLEQERPPPDLVVGGLDGVVREAASKLATHARREGFELEVECPDVLPRVGYDRDAITQIVFNLVDNAIKYARDAARKSIAIRLVVAGPNVELRVRDWGPGAPADQLERIFEPFYRMGEELTRTTQGTGIGLALVRELARGMGASVRAEAKPEGGLEVIVEIRPAR